MTQQDNLNENKRNSPRIDFHLDVAISGREGLEEVKNLSLYGAFIQTQSPIEYISGEEIFVGMRFPHENKALHMKSRIAHISELGFGVEFVDLPPQDAMSLEYCYNIFKSTIPMPEA